MLVDQDLARHRGRYYGKYAATVSAVDDPERLGRVEVKVPALFTEPVWARPCLPYGCYFIPPVGAQVWVEFEAGDLERPIWSGTWLGPGKWPDEAKKPQDRLLKTTQGFFVAITDQGITLQVDPKNKIEIKKGKIILTGEAIEAVKGK